MTGEEKDSIYEAMQNLASAYACCGDLYQVGEAHEIMRELEWVSQCDAQNDPSLDEIVCKKLLTLKKRYL